MTKKLLVALAAATALVGATALLSGCSSAPKAVTVDAASGTATVPVGGELTIELGEINPSVGESWVIVTDPDPAVLSGGTEVTGEPEKDGLVGAPTQLSYAFTAVATGTTTVEFEYQLRGETPKDAAEQRSASVRVTVE